MCWGLVHILICSPTPCLKMHKWSDERKPAIYLLVSILYPTGYFFSDSNWTAILLTLIHILSGIYPQISVLPYFPSHFLEETTDALLVWVAFVVLDGLTQSSLVQYKGKSPHNSLIGNPNSPQAINIQQSNSVHEILLYHFALYWKSWHKHVNHIKWM